MSSEILNNNEEENGAKPSRKIPAALAFVFALTVVYVASLIFVSTEVDSSEELGIKSIKNKHIIRGGNSSDASSSSVVTSNLKIDEDAKKKNHPDEYVHLISVDTSQLLRKANAAKDRMEKQLVREYSRHFAQLIFHNHDEIIKISMASKKRMKRRMMLKVLGINGNTFSWMTAGHSAAAAHGNLYHQSYTHSIHDIVHDVFTSVGLDFKATNFAMGGMRSGPELCLCMEAVYGNDIDVLSWDFGMTDGRDSWKLSCWGSRASALPSRPVLALIDGSASRFAQLRPFESQGGMATFQMDFSRLSKVVTDALSDSEEELTPAVKYLVCGKKIESTELCDKFKFNTTEACGTARIKGQTSWHPGW